MRYDIDYKQLTDLFAEEVSRVGQMSRAENGTSLYDIVHELSQDANAVRRFIDDTIHSIQVRLSDVCVRKSVEDTDILLFRLPDMDVDMETQASEEITRTIVMGAVAKWLTEKSMPRYEEYGARTEEALTKAVGTLKTRRQPLRHRDEY